MRRFRPRVDCRSVLYPHSFRDPSAAGSRYIRKLPENQERARQPSWPGGDPPMSDKPQFEFPEAVRELAERNVEQARSAYNQFIDMARKVQDTLSASHGVMTSSAVEMQIADLQVRRTEHPGELCLRHRAVARPRSQGIHRDPAALRAKADAVVRPSGARSGAAGERGGAEGADAGISPDVRFMRRYEPVQTVHAETLPRACSRCI